MDFHELLKNAPKDGKDSVLKLYYLDLLVKAHKREELMQKSISVLLKMILDIGDTPLSEKTKNIVTKAVDNITMLNVEFEKSKE